MGLLTSSAPTSHGADQAEGLQGVQIAGAKYISTCSMQVMLNILSDSGVQGLQHQILRVKVELLVTRKAQRRAHTEQLDKVDQVEASRRTST